jgi:hypothetical protein
VASAAAAWLDSWPGAREWSVTWFEVPGCLGSITTSGFGLACFFVRLSVDRLFEK